MTGEEPGIRRGGRAARRARGNWAAATDGSAGTGEMPAGPLDPSESGESGRYRLARGRPGRERGVTDRHVWRSG